MSWGFEWRPYVSVGQKKNQAVRYAAQLAKKQKRNPEPVVISGRQIARTFWGRAWCDNLTAYQDYSNRLPRGATYVRNGSVVDLVIKPKQIDAIVAGSEPYTVRIEIRELEKKRWKAIRSDCSESIDSLLDLLSGKLSDGVMRRLTDQKTGLFPAPGEIRMSCSCPDYSSCCKHLAAVMYGVGARLDSQPELLFLLRGVDHQELVSQAIAAGNLDRELSGATSSLDSLDLGAIFGIELEGDSGGGASRKPEPRGPAKTVVTEPARRKSKVPAKKTSGVAGTNGDPGARARASASDSGPGIRRTDRRTPPARAVKGAAAAPAAQRVPRNRVKSANAGTVAASSGVSDADAPVGRKSSATRAGVKAKTHSPGAKANGRATSAKAGESSGRAVAKRSSR